jgi:hypothetical protein
MRHDQAPEAISPELALVCPELAAAARASLPDRPWEVFAPPPPRERPALRLVSSPATAAPAPAPLAPAPRRTVRRPALGTALGVLAAAGLVVTGLLPARDAPTLRRTTTPLPRPAPQAPAKAPLIPPGAYEVNGGGTLLVVGGGTTLTGFAPPNRCLPNGATLQAPIAADGSFGVVYRVGGSTVELSGRIVDGRISGSYRARRPGCVTLRVPFIAVPERATPARGRHG